MPAPSKVALLPEEIRAELERRLLQNGFSGYVQLSDWLASQGFEIKKSALNEFGQDFKQRVNALKVATQQARAIVQESPDDEGAMSEALMRLTQEKLFDVLLKFQIDPDKVSSLNLGSIARAIAELGRASVTQKKWQAEVRDKARVIADEFAQTARKSGGAVTEETIETFRRKILGIAD